MKYLTVLGLYGLFALASGLAGLVGLLGLLVPGLGGRYAGNVMHSMDMLLAALLGWNGRSTVSKECGREQAKGKPCRFCRVVCAVLDRILESGHCAKEAKRQ